MTPFKLFVVLPVVGLLMWAALIFGAKSVMADHMACSRPALSWPRTVAIATDAPGQTAWRGAISDWNRQGTVVQFREVPYGTEADVYVLNSSRYSTGHTRVQMPCGRTDSIVYAGTDVDLGYWATHEMGHTLSLADHITRTTNPTYYINPKYCPDAYSGVMSYCTPRSSWWGANDAQMLWWHF